MICNFISMIDMEVVKNVLCIIGAAYLTSKIFVLLNFIEYGRKEK